MLGKAGGMLELFPEVPSAVETPRALRLVWRNQAVQTFGTWPRGRISSRAGLPKVSSLETSPFPTSLPC